MTDPNLEKLEMIAVVPVFNPEPGLMELCGALKDNFSMVLVVDDGSIENVDVFDKLSSLATIVRHGVNFGKGCAIKTAFKWMKAHAPSTHGAVFVDGDGQHKPCDVRAVASRMLESGRITLGVRDFTKSNIPLRSRFGNIMTSWLVRLLYKIQISDTQTGLRAIPRRLFDVMISTPGERFEYEMRLFGTMRKYHEQLEQVPINTIYIANNRSSHFRPLADSAMVIKSLMGITR